ncbi:enoyl-ACP reductase FabI [Embleya scabrispora]|uniref:enoyl-ACP reductase FabI n=1 Tax=Embleya scabrispora TaxID=159449 RepID=UPI00037030A1|nr:enoyl-ACP reductase FabI [Embleya scabrispora]MYS86496.1 enoyl-ACP reductase FabI [Streptomyces sp. SID5474]
MGDLLAGKRILVTGVITDASIGFQVAKRAQEEGAEVVLTGFGRLSLVNRIANRLPKPAPVIELDATNPEHLAALADNVRAHVPALDGVVHSIAFGPKDALGGNFLNTEWSDVATAVEVSAYSLKSLTMACLPLIEANKGRGGSVVGLDFDAQVAWPGYDWMGVAKAALESTSRYLAKYLGEKNIRVNLISSGPVKTMAANSIPGFEKFEGVWNEKAPLGWDLRDSDPAARGVCALLSDWFPKTTGEVIHVDGGLHAIGA